jgi:hypothetical protein
LPDAVVGIVNTGLSDSDSVESRFLHAKNEKEKKKPFPENVKVRRRDSMLPHKILSTFRAVKLPRVDNTI